MGVVVRRYIDFLIIIIIYPYSTCINSFLAAASLLLCSFKKCFFSFLFLLFLCYRANIAQRIFEIVQKSRSRKDGNIIISTRTYVRRVRVHASPETSTCEVLRDVSKKLQLTLCAIMAL